MSAIEPEEVGGGMVDRVFPDNYFVSQNFPDREEAGTPNILGAITLGASSGIITATKFVGDASGLTNIVAISTAGFTELSGRISTT